MVSAVPATLHVAVSGASGLIGSSLVRSLGQGGHRISRLVRRPAAPGEISWDPERGRLRPGDLEGVDAVVHLAGENVGVRWTKSRKRRIRDSRLKGTRLISTAIASLVRRPAVLISASAIGIYGNRGDEVLTETSRTGDPADFFVALGTEWEAAADPARAAGIRVVHPRFGIVLSPDGGALARMLLPFRLGVGGRLGDGSQWMSWVSIHDAVGALEHMLGETSLEGPVNVTAPEPVTNREFTRILGKVLDRPAVLRVPGAALKAVYGEMAEAAILSSARVEPRLLLDSGYRFQDRDLESALRHVLRRH
jgi:uncharacterized protein (TIGR01777 family)